MSELHTSGAALPKAAQHLAPDLEVERLEPVLAEHKFFDLALAMRAAAPAILTSWRECSIAAMPDLGRMSVDELESTFASVLAGLAGALSGATGSGVRDVLARAPVYGRARAVQDCSPQMLLAEERILRSVAVVELRRELNRPLAAEEAAVLHQLLDLVGERSLLALIGNRAEVRERALQEKIAGVHRLADVGTLVAGVAHDASNLLLPLRMRLEHLERADLPSDVHEDVVSMTLIVKQFQNSIVNLRWLSIDPMATPSFASGGGLSAVVVDLAVWADDVSAFHRRMLPPGIDLRFDVPVGLPRVTISSAALSQAVFNLIHNAVQAIREQAEDNAETGAVVKREIVVCARPSAGGSAVELVVEDDGPGMPPAVLERCGEPFFTTRKSGSGLGLALVHALVARGGGRLTLVSPRRKLGRGVEAVLTLPVAMEEGAGRPKG